MHCVFTVYAPSISPIDSRNHNSKRQSLRVLPWTLTECHAMYDHKKLKKIKGEIRIKKIRQKNRFLDAIVVNILSVGSDTGFGLRAGPTHRLCTVSKRTKCSRSAVAVFVLRFSFFPNGPLRVPIWTDTGLENDGNPRWIETHSFGQSPGG